MKWYNVVMFIVQHNNCESDLLNKKKFMTHGIQYLFPVND